LYSLDSDEAGAVDGTSGLRAAVSLRETEQRSPRRAWLWKNVPPNRSK
jgi:hypothetical protein